MHVDMQVLLFFVYRFKAAEKDAQNMECHEV